MKIIKRVTQFPLQAQPEGDIAYNINTKQLRVYKDDNGTFVDYDSFYVSPDVDALSVNGYYPLYRSESLANAASPLGTSHSHNATDLGTAPAGIDYPLYMPNGLDTMYHGNYMDPLADDDSDGIPNFRDPAIVGLTALPSAGIKSGSPYTTPLHSGGSGGGVTIAAGDITNEINEPGSGSYNDTDKTITLNATGPGLLIKSDGSLNKFNQGDSVSIEPGDTFVYQGGMTGSGQSSLGNTGGDSANYSGSGNFTTNGGAVVDLEDALKAQNDGTIDAGTQNNTGSSITKPFSGTGILVDDAGNITPVTSPATIPPGSTLFVKSGGKNDSLHWDGSTMPFTTPDGTSIDLTNHLTNDGSGTAYINNSGGTASVSWTGDGLLVSPQGAVTQVTSPYDVPAGWMIFTGTYESSSSGGGGGSSTGTDAGYTGGDYSTGGGSVNVESELGGTSDGTIDGGTSNGGGSNISKTFDDTKQTAILVDDTTGVVTQVTGSPVTIPPGSTLFIKTTPVPTAPTITVNFLTENSVSITWSDEGQTVTQMNIFTIDDITSKNVITQISSDNSSGWSAGKILNHNTSYLIQARGSNSSGDGPWSNRYITIGAVGSGLPGGGSSTGTDAGYTGGDYSTGGGSVNVESELGGTSDGTIDGGTSNGGGSNISKTFDDTKQTAILVDDSTGVVTQVTGSPVTIPPGSTLFVKTINSTTGAGNISDPLITASFGGDASNIIYPDDGVPMITNALSSQSETILEWDFGEDTPISALRLYDYVVGTSGTSSGAQFNLFSKADGNSTWLPISFAQTRYTSGSTNTGRVPTTVQIGSIQKDSSTNIIQGYTDAKMDFVGRFNGVSARHWKLDIVQFGVSGQEVIIDSALLTNAGAQTMLAFIQIDSTNKAPINGEMEIDNFFTSAGHTELLPNASTTYDQENYENLGPLEYDYTLDSGKVALVLNSNGTLDEVTTASSVSLNAGQFIFVKQATSSGTTTPTQYTLTINTNSSGTQTGSGSYLYNDNVSISATPTDSSQHEFQKWRVISGAGQSFFDTLSSTGSFTMPSNDVVIEAVYQPVTTTPAQYTITFSHDGNSSGVSVNPTSQTHKTGDVLDLSNYNFKNAKTGYAFNTWVLVSGSGSLANADNPETATFTVGGGTAELQATFTAVQSGPAVGTGDTLIVRNWEAGKQISASVGQWSGAFTLYGDHNTSGTNHTGMEIRLNMDSSAFTIGASSADQIEYFLGIPTSGDSDGSGNLIKVSYNKTYQINTDSAANTILTITLNSKQYTFDFNTAGNQSHSFGSVLNPNIFTLTEV